jgi:hypothetical protein
MNYPLLFPKTTNLFFVVGNMRSGTTWLQRLFDHHPEIVCRGEMHALETPEGTSWTTLETLAAHSADLRGWYWRSNNHWSNLHVTQGNNQDFYKIDDQLKLDYVRFHFEWTIVQFVERNITSWPKFVGDRTPAHTRGIFDSINRFFRPYNPVVFHIVRDPRDVLVSYWYHIRRLQNEGRFDFAPLFHDQADRDDCARLFSDPAYRGEPNFIRGGYRQLAERLIKEWIDVNGAALRAHTLFGDTCHTIRYEDLKEDVFATMTAAFTCLGARSDSETLKSVVDAYQQVVNSGVPVNLRKGISGEWKECLRPGDLALFEPCRDLMGRYGYDWSDR